MINVYDDWEKFQMTFSELQLDLNQTFIRINIIQLLHQNYYITNKKLVSISVVFWVITCNFALC